MDETMSVDGASGCDESDVRECGSLLKAGQTFFLVVRNNLW